MGAPAEGSEARSLRPPAKHPGAFLTISEVSAELDVPQHVLRFWETRFSQIRPMKRGGGRRYYRPEDVALLRGIRHLLYSDGYTIKGVQKLLRESGAAAVVAVAKPLAQRLAEHRDAAPVVAFTPADAEDVAEDDAPVETAEAPAAEPEELESPVSALDAGLDDDRHDLAYWRGLARELRRELLEIRAILADKSKT